MCILFLYCNPRPCPGTFRLVLAMNRDEVLARPTSRAGWGERGDFLGGRDREVGKEEGGTWFGVDRRGRMAALTNIFTGMPPNPTLRSRGGLAVGFLRVEKGTPSPYEYASKVAEDADKYNPFNLCLLEMDCDGIYSGQYVCGGKEPEGPRAIGTGFFGLGNHPASSPFRKTSVGLEAFRKAVESFGSTSKKDSLLKELVSLMANRTQYYPDPQAERQASGGDIPLARMKAGTAIFVDLGPYYGTRTQTFVLVDHDKKVTFLEKNRPEQEGADWTEQKFEFRAEV